MKTKGYPKGYPLVFILNLRVVTGLEGDRARPSGQKRAGGTFLGRAQMIFSDSRLPHRRGITHRKMSTGHRHHENVLSTRGTQYIFILNLRVVTGLEGECEPHGQIKTCRGHVFREGADELIQQQVTPQTRYNPSQDEHRSPAPWVRFKTIFSSRSSDTYSVGVDLDRPAGENQAFCAQSVGRSRPPPTFLYFRVRAKPFFIIKNYRVRSRPYPVIFAIIDYLLKIDMIS